ncbi:MAG: hypothetical protein JXN64_08390 [Spirochaetes bacterium]|nr:hypothetical protein [Spirochaetota bacterium]
MNAAEDMDGRERPVACSIDIIQSDHIKTPTEICSMTIEGKQVCAGLRA